MAVDRAGCGAARANGRQGSPLRARSRAPFVTSIEIYGLLDAPLLLDAFWGNHKSIAMVWLSSL